MSGSGVDAISSASGSRRLAGQQLEPPKQGVPAETELARRHAQGSADLDLRYARQQHSEQHLFALSQPATQHIGQRR
jgi:hypothetical protein